MPWQNTPADRRKSSAAYGAEYRRNRTKAMQRARWRCELRLEGCIGSASECDHVVSVADGGGHDPGNLRAACAPCHARRTAEQGNGGKGNGRRYTQRDPSPVPRTRW